MKKITIVYWIITGLFASFMLFTAIPNILVTKESVQFIGQLGYPQYFIPFIGVAKALGCIAILIPGFPRIKEWAYAGLFFDLVSAIYSLLMTGTTLVMCTPLLVPVILGIASYVLYHKKSNTQKA